MTLQCIVSQNGVYGGGEHIVLDYALNTECVVFTNSKFLYNKLLKINKKAYLSKYEIFSILGMFDYLLQIFQLIIKYKVKLIISHHRRTTLLAGILSKLFSIQMVHYAHYYSFNNKYLKYFCGKFIAVSNAIKENLINNYKINPKQIQVIYNGVNNFKDTEKCIEFINTFKFDKNIINIGIVGRLTELKGHMYLLEAINDLKNATSSIFKLYIVGDGELYASIKYKLHQNNLEDFIELVGFYDGAPSLMFLFDIIIQPSLSEGLPFTVLEALNTESLIIVSDIKPHIEIFDNTYSLYCKPKDVSSIVNSLKKAINILDLKKENEYFTYYKNILANKFTSQKMLKNFIQYENELING